MSNFIMCLARVFSEEKYAKDFINKGQFRCNTLNYFKNYKDEFLNNIGDKFEGISSKFNSGDGVELKIKNAKTEEWDTITDFVDLQMHSNSVLTKNVFCMYAPNVKMDQEYSPEEFDNIIKLQDEMDNLGEYLVLIVKPEIFFDRLKVVAENKKLKIDGKLISYRDFSKSFSLCEQEVGFIKSDEFSHQKEYRIMIDKGDDEDTPLDLEIGSLEDIAILLPTSEFNSRIKVVPKDEIHLHNIVGV